MRLLVGQLTRFGLVGAVGLVVDFTLFNLLRATVFSPERVEHGSFLAAVVSTSVAIAVNWMGNRWWAFRRTGHRPAAREGIEFAVVSVLGMLIGLACLWVSREVLGYTSTLADNVAKQGVGLALGTVFRFTLYKWWVFAPKRARTAPAPAADEVRLTSVP